MLFFGKFYVTKKPKNVEIVFGISKAKSGSIATKIRQPFLWTDPYLHCLWKAPLKNKWIVVPKSMSSANGLTICQSCTVHASQQKMNRLQLNELQLPSGINSYLKNHMQVLLIHIEITGKKVHEVQILEPRSLIIVLSCSLIGF